MSLATSYLLLAKSIYKAVLVAQLLHFDGCGAHSPAKKAHVPRVREKSQVIQTQKSRVTHL